MSGRELYEAVLIEQNKVSAPAMLLEDFNYFVNKAFYQYINKRYSVYDVNQQTTDDLQELKTSIIYTGDQIKNKYEGIKNPSLKNTKVIELPDDYFHILNCQLTLTIPERGNCPDLDKCVSSKATKLTADIWNTVTDNYWNRPSYKKPYFYIHSYDSEKTSYYGKNFDKQALQRYGNAYKILCEIRFGESSDVNLDEVIIDYIRTPQTVVLTQEQLDSVEDNSQILEFPDYVCQEIKNELTHITMENQSDQRVTSHQVVSESIAAQQQ